MIPRPEIESFMGLTVRIEYRTSKRIKARTGTLRNITISKVHIESTGRSGRDYRIPIQAVRAISEVVA